MALRTLLRSSSTAMVPLGHGPGGQLAVKSEVSAPVEAKQFASMYSLFLNPQEITPYQAWLLYKSSSALARVVDLIADDVASLTPMIKVEGEVIDDHPILKFLAKPGFNRTRRRFIKELTVQYLVTGTCYPMVIGNPRLPPLAFDVLKSRNISVFPGADMWPDTLAYSEGTRSARFVRDGNPRDPRYIDDTNQLSEVVPIYDMDGDQRGIGLSRLNAIRHDVEVRYKGIQHNAAVLDNGARLSGVLAFKEQLSEEQKNDISEMLRGRTTGANAGGVLVTTGGESEFTALSQSAKDMDFANLIKIVEDAIVTRYNVPVTLYSVSAQTNNNYKQAFYAFYQMAVLPTFQVIYSGLSRVFTERLGVEIEIVHDALTNPVLAEQAAGRGVQLFSSHLVSRNEAREIVGYEPVLGGDTIYGPLGEQPVGEDFFTGNDEHLSADGFQNLRRERNPEQVAPGEGEQHDIDQQRLDEQAAAAAKKPAAAKLLEMAGEYEARFGRKPVGLSVKAMQRHLDSAAVH